MVTRSPATFRMTFPTLRVLTTSGVTWATTVPKKRLAAIKTSKTLWPVKRKKPNRPTTSAVVAAMRGAIQPAFVISGSGRLSMTDRAKSAGTSNGGRLVKASWRRRRSSRASRQAAQHSMCSSSFRAS